MKVTPAQQYNQVKSATLPALHPVFKGQVPLTQEQDSFLKAVNASLMPPESSWEAWTLKNEAEVDYLIARQTIFNECKNGDLPSEAKKIQYVYAIAGKALSELMAKGNVVRNHIFGVMELTQQFVEHLSKRPEYASVDFEPQYVKFAAAQHDLGKANIDKSIIEKVGALTDTEWGILLNHPAEGIKKAIHVEHMTKVLMARDGVDFSKLFPNVPQETVQKIKDEITATSEIANDRAMRATLCHHCYYDGGPGGYIANLDYKFPQLLVDRIKRLDIDLDKYLVADKDLDPMDVKKNKRRISISGDQLPLRARIIAIVDSYEAMTADRKYNKSKTPQEACAELIRCSKTREEEPNGGGQFDPKLVKEFVEMINNNSQDVIL
jgi:hypothetical protein